VTAVPQGFTVEESTGALLTLPWTAESPRLPSLFPYVERWAAENLVHHLTGRSWRWTREQRRFWHLWYALDDDGRWLYRSGVKRRSKGAGKDPDGAAWLLCELCGPVRFAGWSEVNGERVPLARPEGMALCQVAANSEAQARDVLAVANAMVSLRMKDRYGIDAGILRTNATANGGRLELLTSSMKSAEGDPATAIMLNESHHMTKESGGHALAGVARRNVGKSPGGLARTVEFTNAHDPGRDSVAEQSYDAWVAQVAGRTRTQTLLYDSREWPSDTRLDDEASLMAGLRAAYADSPWVDLETIRDEVWDPRTTPSDSRRFYGNQINVAEDAWLDPKDVRETSSPLRIADGDEVVIFGDGSKSDDATGLLLCRMSDGLCQVAHVQQPAAGRNVDRAAVDLAVRQAMGRFRVAAFWFDPSHAKDTDATGDERWWWPLCDEWMADFGKRLKLWAVPAGPTRHAVAWDMTLAPHQAMFVPAVEQVQADFEARAVVHDGSAWLVDHLTNARQRPGKFGVSIGKTSRDSKRKIDLGVCLVGARMLRRQVQLSRVGGKSKRSAGGGRVVVLG
jgi:hypothetical protein